MKSVSERKQLVVEYTEWIYNWNYKLPDNNNNNNSN